ncbi:MAG: hypothetical protein ACD_8C00041G0006 [uncultured bacterium]|nr:MAG: hypothetical protein ACD_8C00041G0006 [uncultured bacterium]
MAQQAFAVVGGVKHRYGLAECGARVFHGKGLSTGNDVASNEKLFVKCLLTNACSITVERALKNHEVATKLEKLTICAHKCKKSCEDKSKHAQEESFF